MQRISEDFCRYLHIEIRRETSLLFCRSLVLADLLLHVRLVERARDEAARLLLLDYRTRAAVAGDPSREMPARLFASGTPSV